MGLKRLFLRTKDPAARGEAIVQTCQHAYTRYEDRYPDAEPHELLGYVWHAVRRLRRRSRDRALGKPAFVATYLYACLEPPVGARALGLWILCTARPEIARGCARFCEEYYRLMNPIFDAQARGELTQLYRRYNPRCDALSREDMTQRPL